MLTVLHVSDLQCGRPFVPASAEALFRLAQSLAPDVVVVSGDLTQRAKVREFRDAVALLERLPSVPTVVTPGNHDVPLYRIWERALSPYRNWKRFVSGQLDTVTERPGVTLVALNSAAPHRAIVNGRLGADQIELARRAFARATSDAVRIVVVHHHFVPTADGTGGRPLPRARAHVAALEEMGAQLVLGGHVHRTQIATSRVLHPDAEGPGLPLISCGTTTSRRGRGPEEGVNSLNVVRVGAGEVEVTPHRLEPGADDFTPAAPTVLAMPSLPGGSGVSTGAQT